MINGFKARIHGLNLKTEEVIMDFEMAAKKAFESVFKCKVRGCCKVFLKNYVR